MLVCNIKDLFSYSFKIMEKKNFFDKENPTLYFGPFVPMKPQPLPGRNCVCARVGRPARTYVQQLCEDTGCNPEDLPEAMNDREKWRETVKDIRAGGAT